MSKNILEASLEGAEHIVLLGHIHPDGDCIGTTLGLLNYLRENYPQIEAELFLDHPAAKFSYMNDFEKIHTEIVPEKQFDLCITRRQDTLYRSSQNQYRICRTKLHHSGRKLLQRSVIHAS